jgi:Lon-like protease
VPRVMTASPNRVTTPGGPPVDPGRQRPADPPGAALIAAIAILIVAVFNLDIPYFAITPGPAIDVVQLIDIKGAQTKKVTGPLLLTTVSLHRINVAEAIRGWFDSSYEILSRSALIPPGETEEQANQHSVDQMTESQQHASAAALSFLGYQVKVIQQGARVADLVQGAPAADVLRRGDVIIGVDTTSVAKAEDVTPLVKRHKVGDELVIKLRRGGELLSVRTKTVENPESSEPMIGVKLDNVPQVKLPLAVRMDSRDIGGPSAGLMYALGVVDLLDASDLARGRVVAGTGEIDVEGNVAAVGGVGQKIAGAREVGADLFLVPADELREACGHADDLPVYGVSHLADAVRVLKDQTFADERACP